MAIFLIPAKLAIYIIGGFGVLLIISAILLFFWKLIINNIVDLGNLFAGLVFGGIFLGIGIYAWEDDKSTTLR